MQIAAEKLFATRYTCIVNATTYGKKRNVMKLRGRQAQC